MRSRGNTWLGAGHVLVATAVVVPILLLGVTGTRDVKPSPLAHFWPVLLTAGTAAAVAAAVTAAGLRARDGRAILLGAAFSTTTALLAVCDVYDALVSDRVYRTAWTPDRALSLLHEESGSGYDPDVVDALERVVAPADGAPPWVAGLAAPPVQPKLPRRAPKPSY